MTKVIIHRSSEAWKNYLIFLLCLIFLVGLVSSTANISIQYGWNGSDYVPFKTTADGTLKTDINKANFTSNLVSVGVNLTVGSGIIQWNSSGSNFIYHNGSQWRAFATAGSAPVNAVMAFNLATCPTGWVLADGDNGTPDLRGIFIRGAGTHGTMTYANATLGNFSATYGEYYNDSFQSHRHEFYHDDGAGGSANIVQIASSRSYIGQSSSGQTHVAGSIVDGNYGTPRTGAETRPASYAMIYCVKTETEDISQGLFALANGIISLVNVSNKLFVDSDVNITGSLHLGNGSLWFNDTDAKYYYNNKTAWLDIGSGSGSGETTKKSYTQSGHGFSVGDAVYYNGSGHYKAISNDSAKLGTGIVSSASGDSFDVTYSGYISGLSGLVAGTYYFVSPTTEGELSVTSGSNYSNPLLQATSATTGIVYNWRAVQLSSGSLAVWDNESGVATYKGGDVNITQDLYIGGSITGNIVKVDGALNVTGDIYGNFTASSRQFVYNGTDWVGARSTAEGVQQIYLNDSSRKYDAVPENAVMSFNQATCPTGWVLADGTSGTPDLSKLSINGPRILQIVEHKNGTLQTGSTILPDDNTIPQVTEGNEFMKISVTPISADSNLLVQVVTHGAHSYDGRHSAALFRDEGADAIASTVESVRGADFEKSLNFETVVSSNGTSQTNFTVRVGSQNAGTYTFNGRSSTRQHGGVLASSIIVTEIMPNKTSLIYCQKSAEDSASSNSIWNIIGELIKPVNSSKKLVVSANGVGIDTITNTKVGINLTSSYNDKLVTLNSSTSGDAIFTLPSVSVSNDGEIYRFLNDADYVMTIKPNGTDAIWNSGSGYGIDLPDKGTMVALRYDSYRNKWDVLEHTGGKVLIEGLKLMEPMNIISMYTEGSTNARFPDRTEKHMADMVNDVQLSITSGKFAPAYFDFPGNDEYFYYEDSTDWDIFGTNITGHKTIGFWAYFDDTGISRTLLSEYQDINNYINIERNSGNTVNMQYTSGGTDYINTGGGSISSGTWYHIALIVDGSDVGLYVNGSQVAYDGAWNTGTITSPLFVGMLGSGVQFLNGRMQDLHISYNNPYNANPNSGSTDTFTVPAAPFRGVMK